VTLVAHRPAGFHERIAPLRLVVGDGRIAIGGTLAQIGVHRHASAAVVVGLDAPLRVVAARTLVARAALIAPGFAHALDVRGRVAVFLLPVHAVARDDAAPVRGLAGASTWRELGEAVAAGAFDDFAIVDRALHAAPRAALDDRLHRALAAVAGALGENLPVDVIADAAGLSPSRVMALARAQLGSSLRGYRRWLRAFEVARRYAAGASLTEAALDAGFASSAHLATTSRASFGIRPSQVLSPQSRAAIRLALR
jgi:AraC-like DNA-binding protein